MEFAEASTKAGKSLLDAALEAARQGLRPILMTSLASIAGVLPLAISTGPGAVSQNNIGTGVVGSMLSTTVFRIFFVPLFYVVIRNLRDRLTRRRRAAKPPEAEPQPAAGRA